MTLVLETEGGVLRLDPPTDDAGDGPLIALLPGDDIALHRLLLTETEPRERRAEALMRATDLCAQPWEDVHVAVGPPDESGHSWIALIDRQRMADHLARLTEAGERPAHVVPAALLLGLPEKGPTLARFGDRVLLRTDELAGLVEPAMASTLSGGSLLGRFVSLNEFAPTAPPDPLPLDLLQGDFAPRTAWWRDRRIRLWGLLLALLVLVLALAPSIIERARHAAAIAAYDRAVVELAEQALGQRPADAQAGALALADARKAAEGAALAARLTYATAIVESVPGARFDSVSLLPDGTLRIGLGGPADAINLVGARTSTGAFAASVDGTVLTLGDRVAGRAASDSPLSLSMLRLVGARQDAALVAAATARGQPMTPQQATAAFVAAGLADPAAAATGRIAIPAARSTVLLPMIADLEMKGVQFTAAQLRRNADQTLTASLQVKS